MLYNDASRHIVESLGLDGSEIFNAYNEIKSIRREQVGRVPDPLHQHPDGS